MKNGIIIINKNNNKEIILNKLNYNKFLQSQDLYNYIYIGEKVDSNKVKHFFKNFIKLKPSEIYKTKETSLSKIINEKNLYNELFSNLFKRFFEKNNDSTEPIVHNQEILFRRVSPIPEQSVQIQKNEINEEDLFFWSLFLFNWDNPNYNLIKLYFLSTKNPIPCILTAMIIFKKLAELSCFNNLQKKNLLDAKE